MEDKTQSPADNMFTRSPVWRAFLSAILTAGITLFMGSIIFGINQDNVAQASILFLVILAAATIAGLLQERIARRM